jgi:hypothetical protein
VVLFQHAYDATRHSLQEQYGDLGPQYGLLVDRMAAIHTRVSLLESSGRDVDPSEYTEL